MNDMRFEYMTEVHAQTLPIILGGVDCLAKAKAGTGKTLGFAIPGAGSQKPNSSRVTPRSIFTFRQSYDLYSHIIFSSSATRSCKH